MKNSNIEELNFDALNGVQGGANATTLPARKGTAGSASTLENTFFCPNCKGKLLPVQGSNLFHCAACNIDFNPFTTLENRPAGHIGGNTKGGTFSI